MADAPGLRPTSDRARETLFNWLQDDIAGRRVLVVDGEGCLVGIVAQADLVATAPPRQTAELLTQISREPPSPT